MTQITQHEQDGVQIVSISGEAGSAEAFEVGAVVGRLIDQQPEIIVFDLSNLTYISSVALGELIRLANETSDPRRRVALAGMSPKLMEMLRLLRFEQYYELYATLDLALKAVAGR